MTAFAVEVGRNSSAGPQNSPVEFFLSPIELEEKLKIDNWSGWAENESSGNFYHLCSFLGKAGCQLNPSPAFHS
jgi:hypothetical protein